MLRRHHILACIVAVLSLSAFSRAATTTEPTSPKTAYLLSPTELDQYPTPLLMRELIRQAVLLAARDECGWNTRDALLREFDPAKVAAALPADAVAAPLKLDIGIDFPSGMMHIQLRQSANNQPLFSTPFKFREPKDTKLDVLPVVIGQELSSRTDYVDAWKKVDSDIHPDAVGIGGAPEGVEPLLCEVSPMAQFVALQKTYAEIRQHGESPQRLGALVRAYANLGQLTRLQWASNDKVFAARSLLYAQRMVVRAPNSPLGYWHRAYALALVGLHAVALSDLDHAKQLGGAIPPWATLIEPLCKDDVQGLATLAATPPATQPAQKDAAHLNGLASFFCFITVENCGSVPCLLDMAGAALSRNPACMRIMESAGRQGGVGYQRWLSEDAELASMLYQLPRDIHRLPQIPKSVQAALTAAAASNDHIANLANVTQSIIDADEPAEPSFTLAGRLVEEDNFLIAKRQCYVMKNVLGLDAGDTVQSVLPLVKNHPYRRYVESFRDSWSDRPKGLANFSVVDPQPAMDELIYLVLDVDGTTATSGKNLWRAMYWRIDSDGYDLEDLLEPFRHEKTNFEISHNRALLRVSPYSAAGMACMIRDHWEVAEPKAQGWLAKVGPHPAVLGALSAKYVELKQPDKAEPLLKQYVAVAPDMWAYLDLANIYLNRGDEKAWLDTLQQYLARPEADMGLDHSNVQVDIAYHYLEKSQAATALPFADEAAQTESGRSLLCDARVHQAMGDAGGADQLMESEIEHYNDDYQRYLWFRDSGHGNSAQAKASGDRWLQQSQHSTDASTLRCCGIVRQLQGDAAGAKTFFDAAWQDEHDPLDTLNLALCAQQTGDTAARGDALRHLTQQLKPIKPSSDPENAAPLQQLAHMLEDAGDKPLDPAAVDKLAGAASPLMKLDVLYVAARQHQLLGDNPQAIKWYTQCAALPLYNHTASILATAALRDLQKRAADLGRRDSMRQSHARFRTLASCFTAALAPAASLAMAVEPAEPTYRIRLNGSAVVGHSWHMDETKVSDLRWTMRDQDGHLTSAGERIYGCNLTGRITILAVRGDPTKDAVATREQIDIETLCDYDGKTDRQLLKPGTQVQAEIHGRQTVFTIAGHRPEFAAQRALTNLIHLAPTSIQPNYHDRAFGTTRRVRPGDSWPIDAAVIADAMSTPGNSLAPDAVHGNVTLADVETVDQHPWLKVVVKLHIDPHTRGESTATASAEPPPSTRPTEPQPNGRDVQIETNTQITYEMPVEAIAHGARFNELNETRYTGQAPRRNQLNDYEETYRVATQEQTGP